MNAIRYKGMVYRCKPEETLLKMFLRHGVTVPFSCGGGACHVCMHRCIGGDIPERAQKGLRPILQQNRFILLCRCIPSSDMDIELPSDGQRFTSAEVMQFSQRLDGRMLARVMPATLMSVAPGEFLFMHRSDKAPLLAVVAWVSDDLDMLDLFLACPGSEHARDMVAAGELVELQGPVNREAADIEMPDGIDRPFPEPDLMLWQDLQQGNLLARLLKVFYARVFADPLLAPYFEGVTQARLAEKQYNFLRQAITGEKVYFGERPRNSHHWMVIPDNVFDHRADILRDVIREFGLPGAAEEKLMAIEEGYRQDIVKSRPWNKVIFGRVLPLEGYESLILDEGSLCDGCDQAIASGERAIYHVRTGKLYCHACRAG
jgi:ferredoxin/truncated hemoglobin YjbI